MINVRRNDRFMLCKRKRMSSSLILKVLIVLTFLFIDCMLLFGDNTATTHFLIPNYGIMLLALMTFALVWKVNFDKCRMRPFLEKHENLCLLLSSIAICGLQFFITYNIIFRTSWDVSAVWYGAHYVQLNDTVGLQEMSEYYSLYPNNLLLVYVFSRILKLNSLLGEPISNGGMLLAFIQCMVITFSGAVMFKCAKRYVGIGVRWGIYLLYFFLIALSPWIVLPYSDGMGIIFPVILLYLYFRCKEYNGFNGKAVYVFALFWLAAIAYHIKPYSVVVLISISIIEVIGRLIRVIHGEDGIKLVDLIIVLVAAFALICSSVLVSKFNHSMGFYLDNERRMGVSHYLMLGANDSTSGGFSNEDLEFSKSIYDKEDRNKAELTEFCKRLTQMGLSGYADLFVHKVEKNFCDGTYGWSGGGSFYVEIYPSRGKMSDLLRSWYYGFGELYPYNALIRQFLWLFVLVTIPFAARTEQMFDAKKKVLSLSILGFMLYLQIFESHARYVFIFVPLFLLMSSIGVSNLKYAGRKGSGKFLKNGIKVE